MMVILAVVAIAAAVIASHLRPSVYDSCIVSTQVELDEICADQNCIVYVDGVWSTVCKMFHPPFIECAKEGFQHGKYRPVVIDLHLGNPEHEAIVSRLKAGADVRPYGMKSFGGNGLVFWLVNGNVVDAAWCVDLMAPDYDMAKSEKRLFERTNANFP